MTSSDAPFALFDDASRPQSGALLLEDGRGLVEACSAGDALAALHSVDEAVAGGLTAAGYCAYELGYVFEERLRPLLPATGRPLLRFHLFAGARRLNEEALARFLATGVQGDAFRGHMSAALDAPAHAAKLARIRTLIGEGDVYQVNLTFKLRAQAQGDAFATYAALRAQARTGGCAFLHFADEDVLSFSPELFFAVRDGRIMARPMKGTGPRAPDARRDLTLRRELASDPKQQAENLMIVDLLRNDLSRVSRTGSVEVSDLFTVETYPGFHTLTSGIVAQTQGGSGLARLMPALFPCGSVTGAPKIRAMEIIREVEGEPRGVYCGAIGFASRDRCAFNVAIRTVTMREGTVEMGVGGGIVWDSRARSEYEECLLKARFLSDKTPAFRLIETMRFDGARIPLLERHLARLAASARYFGFTFDEARIRLQIAAATAGKDGVHRVRLTLGPSGDVEVAVSEAPKPVENWRYGVARTSVNSGDWRLHHKTTLRDAYERALSECPGADEAVLVNERGEVTEGSHSTLFLERDGAWLTPPLSCGVLDGCLRRETIESGARPVVEQVLRPGDLEQGQVWFANALRGFVRGEPIANAH